MRISEKILSFSNVKHFGLYKRYGVLAARSMTFQRFRNGFSGAIDYILMKSNPSCYPVVVKVETSAVCNLSCPGCLQGQNKSNFKSSMRMPLDLFCKILDEDRGRSVIFVLYHRGEPFLNVDLFSMISCLTRENLVSSVSSNFSLPFARCDFEAMVDSGLSHLIVSVDGASQDVYGVSREGGNLDLVVHNIRELIAVRRRRGSRTPLIEQQCVVYSHNRHELGKVTELARSLGVDRVTFVPDVTRDHRMVLGQANRAESAGSEFRSGSPPGSRLGPLLLPQCSWPWFSVLVKWNGEILPCCIYDWTREKFDFGNINDASLHAIWHGPRYRRLRQALAQRQASSFVRDPFCRYCPGLGS
ncbi:MAG: SPASM domain-containing protein [Magnetococcales bacterium]|nr:SPASM domain-containing protein [Magnetococcales bacterium]